MPEQQKQRAKGRKIGRNKRHQSTLYRATDRLNKNRKRRLRRHLRNHPEDFQGADTWIREYGRESLTQLGVSARADHRGMKKARALRRRLRGQQPAAIIEALAARGVTL